MRLNLKIILEKRVKEFLDLKNIENMTCLEKLMHTGAAFRLNGIVECLDRRSASYDEIIVLRKLKDDKTVLAGRMISDYATALLDILDIEEYKGTERTVHDLINEWK